jgi:hypothetical protein
MTMIFVLVTMLVKVATVFLDNDVYPWLSHSDTKRENRATQFVSIDMPRMFITLNKFKRKCIL